MRKVYLAPKVSPKSLVYELLPVDGRNYYLTSQKYSYPKVCPCFIPHSKISQYSKPLLLTSCHHRKNSYHDLSFLIIIPENTNEKDMKEGMKI